MKTLLITNSIEKSKNYICQQLQNSWDAERKNDNRKKKKDFLKESDKFKIIDSKDKKDKFDSLDKKFIPEVIFIVPELMWANDDVNEGYDVARELITKTYKSEFIQVVFLSVLERKTLNILADVRNRSFVEAFPHVCILDDKVNLQFKYYSEIHFKLIKHLALSDHGRLQKISHEINSIKANIRSKTCDVSTNRNDLIAKLEELSLFQQWTEKKITDEIVKANNATANDQLASISKTIENIIDEISLRLSSKEDSNETTVRNKSNYKVFIIEDDKEYRKFFSVIFSKFYVEVYPDESDKYILNKYRKDFNISEAGEIIKTIGKNYSIFLLDLLFKDDSGNWLNFNGLDLYRLVKEVNPYAVCRIITSLPRGIVAKLVEVIISDTVKPSTDQVFTKKYGFDSLKDSIVESIEKINEECRSKAKAKTLLSPFPKTGIFNWPGIPEFMFRFLHDNKAVYSRYRNISQGFFNQYLEGTLNRETIGWNNGELPKPGMKNNITDSYFLKKFSNIMTHRLIALNEALKSNDFEVNYSVYPGIITNISNIIDVDKGYFQTKLGFNGNEVKDKGNPISFKILFSNLFPEEIIFITNTLSLTENSLLKYFNPDLDTFFKKVLGELISYENWDALALDFDPYLSQKVDIDNGTPVSIDKFPDFSLKQLLNFLQALINNYDKEFIGEIVDFVLDEAPDKIDYQPYKVLIDNLFRTPI